MNTKLNSQVSLFQEGKNSILLKPIYDDLVLKMNTYQKLMRLFPLVWSAETRNVIDGQMCQCIKEILSIFKTFSPEDFEVFLSYAESKNTDSQKTQIVDEKTSVIRTSKKIYIK